MKLQWHGYARRQLSVEIAHLNWCNQTQDLVYVRQVLYSELHLQSNCHILKRHYLSEVHTEVVIYLVRL
jgi:hypothetical protein